MFGSAATGGVATALVTHVDRVQAARLYAGQIEYSYFMRSVEDMCPERGIQLGSDSTQLVAFAAAQLPKDQLLGGPLCHCPCPDPRGVALFLAQLGLLASVRHLRAVKGSLD
jgi:hypothetical protein